VHGKESSLTKIASILDKNFPLLNKSISSSKGRHLAAILFSDIVGYTAMMEQNEQQAVNITNGICRFLNNPSACMVAKY
jgi:class 3 adenylate cyclase